MANEQSINELISESAFAQLTKVQKELETTNTKLADCILTSQKLNAELSKTGGYKEIIAGNKKVQDELAKTQRQQEQTLIVEEKRKQAILKTSAAEAKAAADKILADEKIRQSELKTSEIQDRITKKKLADEQKLIDKENERIAAMANTGKTILSNSQDEIDAYNNTVDGSKRVTSTLNAQNITQARVESQASSLVDTLEDVSEAQNEVSVSTLRVSPAAIAAQRSIRSLEIQLLSYQAIAENATDDTVRETFNRRAEETEAEIARLRNVGRAGFDEFGNAIQRSTGFLTTFWNGLKTVANLLPGIGIAGLLAFAAGPIIEWIKNLEIIKGTAKEIATETAFASDSYKDALTDVNKLRVGITEFHQGIITGTQLIKIYNEGIGKTAGELKNVAEVEGFYNDKAPAYVEAMLLRAKAQAALQKATEEAIKVQERASKGPSFGDYVAASFAKIPEVVGGTLKDTYNLLVNPFSVKRNGLGSALDEIYDLAVKAQKQGVRDLEKDSKTAFQLFADLQLEADKYANGKGLDLSGRDKKPGSKVDTSKYDEEGARIERTRNAFKQLVDDESLTFEKRIEALGFFLNSSRELIQNNYNKDVEQAKGNNAKIKALDEQKRRDFESATIDADKIKIKLSDDASKELIKNLTKEEQDQITAIKDGNEQKLLAIEQYRSEATKKISEQYASGKVSEEQYNQQLYEIEVKSAQDRVQIKIDELKKVIEKEEEFLKKGIGTSKQIVADKAALAAKEIELSGLKTNVQITDAKKLYQAKKEINEKEKELARELLAFTGALVTASFTNQLNAIQTQIDLNEKRKAADVENVNNSVATEEEKANKIAIINARAANEQAALEQKQKEIKIRQAKADKAAAIAGVILNIALAKTKTLGETGFLGLPLLPIIAGIGALQIATILATPIPQFFEGGTMKSDGPALYSEIGPELMIDPSGKLSLTPDKPTIGHVKAGTQFISNKDLVSMMSKPDPVHVVNGREIDLTPLLNAQDNSSKRIIKAINSQKSHSTIITKSGWRSTQNVMSLTESYLKRNFN